jgi:shikimate dehydrogenase
VDIGGFDQAVSHFAAHGGAGLNITLPFKQEAWQMCQRPLNTLTKRAMLAQAVNTMGFGGDGVIHGDNTDGVGLTRDLEINLNCSLTDKRILIIGAGGAVRGVLAALLECHPAMLTVANRTAQKATALASHFNGHGYDSINACSMDRVEQDYDVVINGTAASLSNELPGVAAGCVGPSTLAYDMMYGTEPTLFMKWALELRARQTSDGLGMLVEQAAAAFNVWHDRSPDTAPVISFLRKA